MQQRLLAGIYELREEIGSGGGGVIYKAWHTRLQKDMVLKELKMGVSANRDIQRAEADILKNLRHSYLPQLYDFVVDAGRVYTVIDFIPGDSFDRLLVEGKRFSQQQVVVWARQLLEAITYLHGQKPPILHSDIKPANIMLMPDGNVCLIDFNISLLLGDDGAVAVGRSHGYASPEQYGPSGYQPPVTAPPAKASGLPATERMTEHDTEPMDATAPSFLPDDTEAMFPGDAGDRTALLIEDAASPRRNVSSPLPALQRKLDVRSDIYSLGATLYHMLSGERPSVEHEKIKPIASFGLPIGNAMVFIVEKAMAFHAADRFQTAEQMLDAVRNIQKLDRRWKKQALQRNVTAVLLALAFAAFGATAWWGTQVIAVEKEEHYNTLVYEVEHSAEPGTDALFQEAVALFPSRFDVYHAKAVRLALEGDLAIAREFILATLQIELFEMDSDQSRRELGDLYFILGNSWFEQEDYPNAILQYRQAVGLNSDNPDFYRDYAISLARTGQVDEARELLVTAEKLGLQDDSLALLRGEVFYAEGDYPSAESCFQSVLRITGDDYIRYRAYRIASDVYRQTGDYDKDIGILTEARGILPANRQNEMLERLADAYVHGAQSGEVDATEYYLAAINCFAMLAERGYAPFHIRQNLAVLYQQTGNFDAAEATLLGLEEDYPQDYRVPMRLAYLYADVQAARPNLSRDYAGTKQAYLRAMELYQANAAPGESDPEMLMLDSMISQLRQGGWIT